MKPLQAKATASWLWLLAGATLFTLADARRLDLEAFAGTLAVITLLSISVLRYHPR